jgi:type II secretory pathway predicted ATPase ExeA
MDYLRYGISQAEGFIVITGPPGLGKTMLVKALCEELYDQKIVIGQLQTTQVARNDILRLVMSGFGLSHQGLTKAALLNVLENYFLSKVRRGKRVLLVVDEAHHLSAQSIEELRLLMNLEDQGRQLVQCFLLGQEQLKHTLQQPELEQAKQRVIAAYNLHPLDLDETRQYIEYRLSKAGWTGNPGFDDETFEKIHQYSNGIPRKINLLCNRALAYGYLEELDHISIDVIDVVVKELQEEELTNGDVVSGSNVISIDQSHGDQSVEYRLQRLEAKVDMLKERLRKERRLLRKALLLNLEVRSDTLDANSTIEHLDE